jgi:DNA-binding NarL/FixJ family response regulator
MAGAMAVRARARIELATGNPSRAAELALASVAALDSAGARMEAAVGRALAGKALGEAGDREAAVAQLTVAAEAFARYGAARYRAAAEQDLRGLGERVHRRRPDMRSAGDGVASLSSRETEVARLTVDRLTNREIAGRLFLSEKTIETHMRRVFQKLGVSSRVQVARAVEQADRPAARDA